MNGDNGYGRYTQKYGEHFKTEHVDLALLRDQNEIKNGYCILKWIPKRIRLDTLKKLARVTIVTLMVTCVTGCSLWHRKALIVYKPQTRYITADSTKGNEVYLTPRCAFRRGDLIIAILPDSTK